MYASDCPVIFYDGFCNLCSASVKFILKYEKSRIFCFSSLQSEFVKKNFPMLYSEKRDPESVILYDKGELYYRSDAALRISRELKFPFQLIYYSRIIPVKFRDILYKFVARHRYRFFGKREECFIPNHVYSGRFLDTQDDV